MYLRWLCRSQWAILLIFIVITYFLFVMTNVYLKPTDKAAKPVTVNLTNEFLKKLRDKELEIGVQESQGQGCEVPELDVWSPETRAFNQHLPKVTCKGLDWVKCYLGECATIKEILDTKKDVYCLYKDFQVDDNITDMGLGKEVYGNVSYKLVDSDHVKISCVSYSTFIPCRWFGYKTGLRHVPKPKNISDAINVLVVAFDSTSHNDFVRRMPESFDMLTDELQAVVLNKYNIIGDGAMARFPLFTGQSEFELPDYREELSSKHVKQKNLMYTASSWGYRTIYYDDLPSTGTFQHGLNDFFRQLADHNLEPVLQDKLLHGEWDGFNGRYCVGDTPRHTLKFNLTHQLFHLKGNFFAFVSINYDDNKISKADVELATLLSKLKQDGKLENTLVVVTGEQGNRYKPVRSTYQGKFEELQSFLAIHLPAKLKNKRPKALQALKANADVLTTPFDVHSTLLDILGVWELRNKLRVNGSDIPRGMSLLKRIPASRSCAEAGIVPYWCACASWRPLAVYAPQYPRAAQVLLDLINNVTDVERSKCHFLKMKKIEWVAQLESENDLRFPLRKYQHIDNRTSLYFQAKIQTRPGNTVFEGAMRYFKDTNNYVISIGDISRITDIGHVADCIIHEKPYLGKFCYCK